MNANIEFISYDYDRHSLCMGELVAKVNGNVYRFHYLWENRMKDPARSGEVWCPPFWRSGGCIEQDEERGMWAEEGDWELSVSECSRKDYPEEVLNNLDGLIEMFNANVTHGCCGGCI